MQLLWTVAICLSAGMEVTQGRPVEVTFTTGELRATVPALQAFKQSADSPSQAKSARSMRVLAEMTRRRAGLRDGLRQDLRDGLRKG